jgi:hypothetical protein
MIQITTTTNADNLNVHAATIATIHGPMMSAVGVE